VSEAGAHVVAPLAAALRSSTSLRSLGLDANEIGPEEVSALANALTTNMSLCELNLSENIIGSGGAVLLASILHSAPTLQVLDLSENMIEASGASALANSLATNNSLRALNLTSNMIGPEGAAAFARALSCNRTLTALRLASTGIGGAGACAIVEALERNSSLRELDIGDNMIGDKFTSRIAEVVVHSRLETLGLQNSAISEAGANELATALAGDAAPIQHLNLSVNGCGDEGIVALARALQSNTTLVSLDIEDNAICDVGATALAQGLTHNVALEKLDLHNNGIGPAGAKALGRALAANASLKTLMLTFNQVADDGAYHLAESLKSNSALETLSLASNDIGPDGADWLSFALETNNTLRTLLLSDNSVGSLGAASLADALSLNSSLETLYLSFNEIGTLGTKRLANGLKRNSALRDLGLGVNSMGDSGAKEMATLLRSSTTLESLDVTYNDIGSEGYAALETAMQRNTTLLKLRTSGKRRAFRELITRNRDQLHERLMACLRTIGREGGSVLWGRVKLAVVGPTGSGKSSTVRSLLGELGDAAYSPTSAAFTRTIDCTTWSEVGPITERDILHSAQVAAARRVWEHRAESSASTPSPATSKRKSMASALRRSLSGALRRPSPRLDQKLPIIADDNLVGVEPSELVDYRHKSRPCESLAVWDMSGDPETFLALQDSLFDQEEGMVLLCVALQDLLEEDEEGEEGRVERVKAQLVSWRDTLMACARDRPVIVAATHADTVAGVEGLDRANELLASLLLGLRLVPDPVSKRVFYPVDNLRGSANRAAALRSALKRQARALPIAAVPIQLAWLRVLYSLVSVESSEVHIQLVTSIAARYGVQHGHVHEMLAALHARGVVLRCEDTVILDPNRLFAQLSPRESFRAALEAHLDALVEGPPDL